MRVATTCRDCGKQYEPSKSDILAGNWRVCPDCRKARHADQQPPASEPRAWSWDTLPKPSEEEVKQ